VAVVVVAAVVVVDEQVVLLLLLVVVLLLLLLGHVLMETFPVWIVDWDWVLVETEEMIAMMTDKACLEPYSPRPVETCDQSMPAVAVLALLHDALFPLHDALFPLHTVVVEEIPVEQPHEQAHCSTSCKAHFEKEVTPCTDYSVTDLTFFMKITFAVHQGEHFAVEFTLVTWPVCCDCAHVTDVKLFHWGKAAHHLLGTIEAHCKGLPVAVVGIGQGAPDTIQPLLCWKSISW
jgi:hypothetical protein